MEPFNEKRYALMRNEILSLNPEDKALCDIGCGKNPISKGIKTKLTLTVDSNKKYKPKMVADVSKRLLFKSGTFDIIVLGEIIEHIVDAERFISEMSRILKSEGHVILSVPNICSLRYRIAFMLGKIPAHASKGSINMHVRDYNLDDIKELMMTSGFSIENVQGDGAWMGTSDTSIRLLLPARFSDCIIITARKVKK